MNQQHQFPQNRAIPAHLLSSSTMHPPSMSSMQQMHTQQQQQHVMVCGPSATATNIPISNASMAPHSYQPQPPPQMVHQMPTNVNAQQQQPNPQQQQPQTHQPAPQFITVSGSSQPVPPAHNPQPAVATIASISSASEGPTEVVGRLKMLTEKMLRASILKVLDTAAMSVNNQGGRDNGTADVMSSAGSSTTSEKDSVSALNSKYSNVPLAQDVEECMIPAAKIPKIKKGVEDQDQQGDMELQMSIDTMNPIITSWLSQMGEVEENRVVRDSKQLSQEDTLRTNGRSNDFSFLGRGSRDYPSNKTSSNSFHSNSAENLGIDTLHTASSKMRSLSNVKSLSSQEVEKLKCECTKFKEMLDLVVRDLARLQDYVKLRESRIDEKEEGRSQELPVKAQGDAEPQPQMNDRKQNSQNCHLTSSSSSPVPIKQEPNFEDNGERVQPMSLMPTSTGSTYPTTDSNYSDYIPEEPFPNIKSESPEENEDSSALTELLQQSDSTGCSNEPSESGGVSESEGLVLSDNWYKPRRNNPRPYSYRPVKRETSEEVVVEYLKSVRDDSLQVQYAALISGLDLSSIEACCHSLMKLHNLSALRQGKLYHRVAKGKVILNLRRWIDNDKRVTQILKNHNIFIENAQRRNFVRVYNLYREHNAIVNYDATLTYIMSNFSMIKGILEKGLLSDQYELYPSPEKYMELMPNAAEGHSNYVLHGSLEMSERYSQTVLEAHLTEKEFDHGEY